MNIETIVNENYGLAVKAASTMRTNSRIDFEDNLQVQLIALMNATKKFDPKKGSFTSIFSFESNREKARIMMDVGYDTRITLNMQEMKASKAKNKDLSGYDFIGYSESAKKCLSIFEELEFVSADSVFSDGKSNQKYIPTTKDDYEDYDYLYKCIEKLNQQEKFVVCNLFGLNGLVEKTQSEIASDMGISQNRISQVLHAALKKLKRTLFYLEAGYEQ